MHVFCNLTEVRKQAEQWLADYNTEIPHDSPGGLTPAEYYVFRTTQEPLI
jgi:putative transposase